LGAGSNPQTGQQAANADRDRLKGLVEGADMVFITCGLGGGTGTGASPVIAELAEEANALTVAVVTKPFEFESSVRTAQAEGGAKELKRVVDALITIPNDKLLDVADKNTTMIEAFGRANDVLRQGVQSISDLITQVGLLNVDFADVETIMSDTGSALMGIGIDGGEERAVRATEKAISSPLLEEASIDGARGVLVNFSGSLDLRMHEVRDAMTPIRDAIDPDANLVFGAVIDEGLGDKVKVTVIATGFDAARHGGNDPMPGNKALDLDTILSRNFDKPTFLRKRRPPTRGGVNDVSSSNALEEELDIPTFLRVRKREA
jgi:cell division protein FtsZ